MNVEEHLRLRDVMAAGDLTELETMLREDPTLARRAHAWGADCPVGPCAPLSFLAQASFYGIAKDAPRAAMAELLLEMGAPRDGDATAKESPLISAASYGDLAVAQVLVHEGADLELTGYAVPGGTALAHAVHFGMAEIATMLAECGAKVDSLWVAAGTGDLRGMLQANTPRDEVLLALRAAAVCERFVVMEELFRWGLHPNELAEGGTALHWAAWEGKAASARFLVKHGASLAIVDPSYKLTPVGWARHRAKQLAKGQPGSHSEVIAFLESLES